MTNSRALGARWERVAELYLHKQGLKTITRNFQCRLGEIDLIMEDDDCLVFTEIRYRKNAAFGTGAQSVSKKKQLRIVCTAQRYLQYHDQRAMQRCRFDVMSMGHVNGALKIDWIRNAFTHA